MSTVIIPWRGGDRHRERALHWVRGSYKARLPNVRVHVAQLDDGPWCKARAVMPAVRRAEDGLVIVADADVWTDGLQRAMSAVVCGAASWAVPHLMVKRLSIDGTDRLLRGGSPQASDLDQRPYQGVYGGGIVVAHRKTLLDVPLDPRFTGWGQEDQSWGQALLAIEGPAWRGDADLWHLWHPPPQRMSRIRGSQEGWALRRRYVYASRTGPQAVRDLLKEFDDPSGPGEQALHVGA